MSFIPVEVKPFKSIQYGLSVLSKYKLLGAKMDSSNDFKSDTDLDTLINWMLMTKFLRTLHTRYNQLTIYNITTKSIGVAEGGFEIQVEQSLNDIKIFTNARFNYGDGKNWEMQDLDLGKALNGLANTSNYVLWSIKAGNYYYIPTCGSWPYVYDLLTKVAEKETLPF